MAFIKPLKIRHFSSEDPNSPASNLFIESHFKSWRSKYESVKEELIFEFEQPFHIGNIEITSYAISHISIEVSKKGNDDVETDWHVLVNKYQLLTQHKSEFGIDMLKCTSFTTQIIEFENLLEGKWDLIKIILDQTYDENFSNKRKLEILKIAFVEDKFKESELPHFYFLQDEVQKKFRNLIVGSIKENEVKNSRSKNFLKIKREKGDQYLSNQKKIDSSSQIELNDQQQNVIKTVANIMGTSNAQTMNSKGTKRQGSESKVESKKNKIEQDDEQDNAIIAKTPNLHLTTKISTAKSTVGEVAQSSSTTREVSSTIRAPVFQSSENYTLESNSATTTTTGTVNHWKKILVGVTFTLEEFGKILKKGLKEKGTAMGAKYSNGITKNVTHLIAFEIKECKRKKMRELNKNAYILKGSWMQKSFSAKKRLDEKDFILE